MKSNHRKLSKEERLAQCADQAMKELLSLHFAATEANVALSERFKQHFEPVHDFTREDRITAFFNPWFCKIGDKCQTRTMVYVRVK